MPVTISRIARLSALSVGMLASGLAVNKRCGLAGRPGLPEHGVNQLTHEGAAPSPRLRERVDLCELGRLDLEAQRLFHVG